MSVWWGDPVGPWAWPEAPSQHDRGSGLTSTRPSPSKAMVTLQSGITFCLLFCLPKKTLAAPNLLPLLPGNRYLSGSGRTVHVKHFVFQAFLNPFLCSRRGLLGQVEPPFRNAEVQWSRAGNTHANCITGGNEQVRQLHHQTTQLCADGRAHHMPRLGKGHI